MEGNPEGCTGWGKRCKGNIREGWKESKTETVWLKVEMTLQAEMIFLKYFLISIS